MNIGGGDEYDARTRTSEGVPGAQDGARTTTRTRLPGSEGSNRPPTRPGRSLVTVVAVVVLLIAAIAFANRGDGDGGGGGGGAGSSDGKNDAAAQAQPTAPTGEKPVKTTGDTLPSGFPHTKQGAQSAAANYAVALVSADIVKTKERDAIIQQLFAPDRVTEVQGKMDKAYSPKLLARMGLDENGIAKKDTKYISRTAPVGTTVRTYKGDTAKLDVWCTGVFGNAGKKSTTPVTSDWFTLTVELTWTDGDWKIRKFSQKEGPAPVNGDNTASSADEIAAAVDKFGGFTYAR
ncbi:hypothetical protein ACIGW3_27810 [Streptomyces sp. NPDC053499]|uniref:hypothetical protein n=1 Tax=Streptomyces sp. NPDC053499 TaxID=3365707 RepID=UPI0037D0CFB0